MKTVFGIFIFLVSVCVICNGQDVAGGVVENFLNALGVLLGKDKKVAVDVAIALVRRLRKDEETTKDLTAVEEMVRGLTFDLYDEKVSLRVARGIPLKDYPTVIENFAKRFGISADIKDSLLDASYSQSTDELVLNFKFKRGDTGSFVYGRIATTKDGDKIDMAYSLYTLDFKFSGKVIEHKYKTKLLEFTIDEGVWYDTEERNFGSKEQNDMREYFIRRAISEFRTRYLTNDSQHVHDEL